MPWASAFRMMCPACEILHSTVYLLPDVAKFGLLLDAWSRGSLNNLPKLTFCLHVDMSNLRVQFL